MITAERIRQVSEDGFCSEHDDGHRYAELAQVAAEVAANGTDLQVIGLFSDELDRWEIIKNHESDRIKQLVIAGALIAAEIDRLIRKETAKGTR